MNKAVRVFLCDDQDDIRSALSQVIGALPGFVVTGQAATGSACLEALQHEPADLIVLDVSLPWGGPALAAALRDQHPHLTIVVFSAHSEPHIRQAMLDAGADEYVVKTGRLAPLRSALVAHSARQAEQD